MAADQAVLVRRGVVARWDGGDRSVAAGAVARLAGALSRPASSVAFATTTERVVALTYDDGPEPAATPALLDVLAAAGVTATFFLLAERAERWPALARRIVRDGHEVGVHGLDHADLSALPARVAAARLRDARRRLEDVTGRPVRLARPPYGAQSAGQALLTRLAGLEIILWSAWARDWEDDDAATVAARARAAVHPGAVLLLHDARGDGPPGALPAHDVAAATRLLLDGLDADGYRCLTVGELLAGRTVARTLWAGRRA